MHQKFHAFGYVLVAGMFLFAGCVTQQQPLSEQPAPAPQQANENTAPPESPFAKIRMGMGQPEVFHILGHPTDQETAMTGKVFIPYYFGADKVVTRMHYKGLGRVYVSGGGAGFGGGNRVVKIEYDPEETGFRK